MGSADEASAAEAPRLIRATNKPYFHTYPAGSTLRGASRRFCKHGCTDKLPFVQMINGQQRSRGSSRRCFAGSAEVGSTAAQPILAICDFMCLREDYCPFHIESVCKIRPELRMRRFRVFCLPIHPGHQEARYRMELFTFLQQRLVALPWMCFLSDGNGSERFA